MGPPTGQRGKRVLIVDDDHDVADTLRELLEFEGYQPVVAYDGPEAICLAASFQPEVVLLDLELGSETTGQDICRKISAQHVERPRIIAVTGYGNDGEARLRGLGFDAHVAKPFDMATLLHALCPATEVRN